MVPKPLPSGFPLGLPVKKNRLKGNHLELESSLERKSNDCRDPDAYT